MFKRICFFRQLRRHLYQLHPRGTAVVVGIDGEVEHARLMSISFPILTTNSFVWYIDVNTIYKVFYRSNGSHSHLFKGMFNHFFHKLLWTSSQYK